jgi:hypothetical protein
MFCCQCQNPFYDFIMEDNVDLGYCEEHHRKKLILLGYCRTSGVIDKNMRYVDPKKDE